MDRQIDRKMDRQIDSQEDEPSKRRLALHLHQLRAALGEQQPEEPTAGGC